MTTDTTTIGTFQYREEAGAIYRYQHGVRLGFICSAARWEQQRIALQTRLAEMQAKRERAAKRAEKTKR